MGPAEVELLTWREREGLLTEVRETEKLVESPEDYEGDEEETDGPERVDFLEVVGFAGF